MLGPGIEPVSFQREPTVVPAAAPPGLPGEAAVVRRESIGVVGFVPTFRVRVCHFWKRFCVTLSDEFVPLLGAVLCHFFGRFCDTFGNDSVSLFWTNLCYFWERFCATFLEEFVSLLEAILCHLFGRNFSHSRREKNHPKPTKFRGEMERKSAPES